MHQHPHSTANSWPHRLCVALALVTFPLIWVGGLVTTYDAGMAVPDWPGTYGYNLLLYPWQSWLAAPWDLFIEHGHRLLGATAGLLAIALVTVVWLTDQRTWLRAAAIGALVLVIVQGLLGGARVLLDERLVAMLHACVGPLFFAYLAGLIIATSKWWSLTTAKESSIGSQFARAAWTTILLAYLQLVLGALLRHVPLAASPGFTRAALLLHLIVAAALTGHVLFAAWRLQKLPEGLSGLAGPTVSILALVMVQLLLGLGTYVAKYAFPVWLDGYSFAANFVVQERSLAQSLITTAHVANGSLILFVTVVLALRSSRLFFAAGRVGQARTASAGPPSALARAAA
jgi:heme a synthase